MATNENIVTDRTTEGAKPATIPKSHKANTIIINFKRDPFLLLGTGFIIKVTNNKINPLCNPETDKMWTAPAY
jgi:hypothetical protein